MPSETGGPETATPQETKTADLTSELIADLDSGKRKLGDLDPDLQKKVMDRLENPEAEESPAETPKDDEKPAEKSPETPPAEAAKEPPQEEPKPFDRKKWRRDNQALFDEANQLEQKNKTARERLEKAKAERQKIEEEEKQFKPPEDPWDKDHQANLARENQTLKRRLELIEKRLEDKDQEEVEATAKTAAQKREEEMYGQYHALQDEFPKLKTKRKFQDLDRDYATWNDGLIAASGVKDKMPGASYADLHAAAVKRYESDAEFAKSVPKIPIDESDWTPFQTLLRIHHQKQAEGGRARGIFLEMMDEEGILDESMQKGRAQAAAEAAGRTVDAIKKQESTVQPISPSDGSGKGYVQGDRASVEKAKLSIKSISKKQSTHQPLTPSEREELDRSVTFLETELAGA